MATNIVLTDLTNGSLTASNEWTGTGVFDVLVNAVNKNIEGQYNLGRINATDYANVYLGGLQSVIQQSMQYLLQEKQVEAQVDLLVAQKSEAELDGIAKRAEIEAQTKLLLDQDSELLLNGTKDRALKDKQMLKTQEEIDLLQTQDSELQLNGAKDRALKDEQVIKIQEEVDLLQTQDSELQLNGIKDRLLKDEQISVEANRALQVECEIDKCKKLTFKEMRGITYV